MSAVSTIAATLAAYKFPIEAQTFLLKVWETAQFMDDVWDGEKPENPAAGIYTAVVGLPGDPFLAMHREVLCSALATMYHKWQAANTVETGQDEAHLDHAWQWRAGYYDVVLLVAALCFNREDVEVMAPQLLGLYGETLIEYRKEMNHA